MAKSLRGSENRAVSDLISHGINASAQYAETTGAQLASQIAKESTDSNSKTTQAAASFSDQAALSQSSAQAYSEISSLSSGVRTDQKASVAQLGAMIKADEELGSKGGQVRQQINDQYEKLVSSQGQTAASWLMALWTGRCSNGVRPVRNFTTWVMSLACRYSRTLVRTRLMQISWRACSLPRHRSLRPRRPSLLEWELRLRRPRRKGLWTSQ